MSSFRENLQQYTHLVGGITGGVVSTAACHPMDLLKVRYSGRSCLMFGEIQFYFCSKVMLIKMKNF